MGVYVYSVRRTGIIHIKWGEDVVSCAPLDYLVKPTWHSSNKDLWRNQNLMYARAEAAWDGKERTKLVYVGEPKKPLEGNRVLQWAKPGVLWYDEPRFEIGEQVGYLMRDEFFPKQWVVSEVPCNCRRPFEKWCPMHGIALSNG